MFESAVVYLGLIISFFGLILVVRPIRRLGVQKRVHGVAIAVVGILVVAIGFILPAPESRVIHAESRLDEFVPVWQFNELHTTNIAAPPERVFQAIKEVRADEIALFNTLMWIRRGGRALPESVLEARSREPLLALVTRGGFVYLADDSPRELVVGTVVVAPRGTRGTLTPEVFRKRLRPGFALAVMNFAVHPNGVGGSIVSTETRVFANSQSTRRGFAAYWRVIYPGSALIRRMWLRAIERRATRAGQF